MLWAGREVTFWGGSGFGVAQRNPPCPSGKGWCREAWAGQGRFHCAADRAGPGAAAPPSPWLRRGRSPSAMRLLTMVSWQLLIPIFFPENSDFFPQIWDCFFLRNREEWRQTQCFPSMRCQVLLRSFLETVQRLVMGSCQVFSQPARVKSPSLLPIPVTAVLVKLPWENCHGPA